MLNKAQTSYLVRESFAGFHRRKLTTGVTILIMGSALLVLAILTLVTLEHGPHAGKSPPRHRYAGLFAGQPDGE